MLRDTIFALSSGPVPSGVAIVRVSGPGVRFAFETLVGFVPDSRDLILSDVTDFDGSLIDKCLVVFFEGPNSFTGEDCGEFHLHGSRAVLNTVFDRLGKFDTFRFAEAGEFSRRAFENGRLDLTEIEGLSDLISANTDSQRRLALAQSSGRLRELYSGWRDRLVRLRALIEAEIDFSEEDDIPDYVNEGLFTGIAELLDEINKHLLTARTGEIIRDGFKVTLIGAPNSGKSSLLNFFAKRDVAIVSEYAGTTRDVISVSLNLGGYEVVVSDCAGIRHSVDFVEKLGIEKSLTLAKSSDLVIFLNAVDQPVDISDLTSDLDDVDSIVVSSKFDLDNSNHLVVSDFAVSSVTGVGLSNLLDFIQVKVSDQVASGDDPVLTRLRYKFLLENICTRLSSVALKVPSDLELVSDDLRFASDQLAVISGSIDVEDLLDVVFSEFCVGK